MRLCDTKIKFLCALAFSYPNPSSTQRSEISIRSARISVLMLSVLCNIEQVASGSNFTNRCFSYASYGVQQSSLGPPRLRLEQHSGVHVRV